MESVIHLTASFTSVWGSSRLVTNLQPQQALRMGGGSLQIYDVITMNLRYFIWWFILENHLNLKIIVPFN